MKVSGRSSGQVSVAGLIAMRPGSWTWLCHRVLREGLTVFLLPVCAPELNPAEYLWAHVKHRLANLASVALDRLEALVRNRLKRLQYRGDMLNGFLARTGLSLASHRQHLQAPKSVAVPRRVQIPKEIRWQDRGGRQPVARRCD
ncbi:hypothetical protein ACFVT2_43140 [Streptomyces sp. NPDC058000]|uniref:hypothetical protein n=1 Tax=Streptomyces sp. NPDC058000 TaxID=3346299 RepID=UPI0036EF1DFA